MRQIVKEIGTRGLTSFLTDVRNSLYKHKISHIPIKIIIYRKRVKSDVKGRKKFLITFEISKYNKNKAVTPILNEGNGEINEQGKIVG
jgi:hypothetical protein